MQKYTIVDYGMGGVRPDVRLPWQDLLIESGLILHKRLAGIDPTLLRREFAVLDAALGPERRHSVAWDTSWSVITLVDRVTPIGTGPLPAGVVAPAMAMMPSLVTLIAAMRWTVVGSHIYRLPPHSILPWHFEEMGPRFAETRVLVPIHSAPEAVTWFGDDGIRYPDGTVWTGDFAFPHQVDNPSDRERIMAIIDVRNEADTWAGRLTELEEKPEDRTRLSSLSRSALLDWRARRSSSL